VTFAAVVFWTTMLVFVYFAAQNNNVRTIIAESKLYKPFSTLAMNKDQWEGNAHRLGLCGSGENEKNILTNCKNEYFCSLK